MQPQQSKPTALKPKLCNPGTLKPYDPRTLKPWNFQTYNNPQKIQTPEKFKTEILEPLNS